MSIIIFRATEPNNFSNEEVGTIRAESKKNERTIYLTF